MTISEEAIRQRSFEIWQREGRPDGKALEHWFQARDELETELLRLRSFTYWTVRCESSAPRTAVMPRPRIRRPPVKRVADRVPEGARPSAAA